MKRTNVLFSALAAVALVTPALAEAPSKPIQLIVPRGAGDATDQVTRVVAELADVLGQKIVVINQTGACQHNLGACQF